MLAGLLLALLQFDFATLIPSNPTTRDAIVLRVVVGMSGHSIHSVTRTGNTFTVNIQAPEGGLAVISDVDVPLGALPAGNYTGTVNIVEFDGDVTFYGNFAFAVNAAAVPALSAPQLLALLASLAVAGVVLLRVRAG